MFPYKNPITISQSTFTDSVARSTTFGNTFSILNIGGHMEVWNLTELGLTLTASTYPSQIQLSANTIPIDFTRGTGSPFSSNSISLNSDNISSGRRRLGMQVFVQETGLVYQFNIPEYETLWNNLSGLTGNSAVTQSDYSTVVNSRSQAGVNFISAWTGSTIEGVNGVTRENARWRIFGGDASISVSANTGLGIVSANTLFTTYNTLLEPTLTTPFAVGGIPAGTSVNDISGDTFVTLFNDLLFPTVLPTYTIPTISLGGASNTLDEVGRTLLLSLTPSGTKNDAGVYTQLRVLRNSSVVLTSSTVVTTGSTTSIPNQFGYADPNNPNIIYSLPVYGESYILPAPSGLNTSTSTTYSSDGNYNSGLPKNNNKGALDVRASQVRSVNAPQSASNNYGSTTYTYTAIYPYFWGVSTDELTSSQIADIISGNTGTKVLSSASGTITIPFGAVNQYLWVAVFSNYTTKTKWYVDALNNGSIGGTTNLFGSPTTQSVNSPNSYWSGINFKIYISNYQTTNSSMELRNT